MILVFSIGIASPLFLGNSPDITPPYALEREMLLVDLEAPAPPVPFPAPVAPKSGKPTLTEESPPADVVSALVVAPEGEMVEDVPIHFDAGTDPESKTTNAPPQGFPAQPIGRFNPQPVYPSAARRQGWQGLVVLEVMVETNGIPSSVIILKSSGYSILDQEALGTVRTWRFSPGRIGSVATASTVQIPIRFRIVGDMATIENE